MNKLITVSLLTAVLLCGCHQKQKNAVESIYKPLADVQIIAHQEPTYSEFRERRLRLDSQFRSHSKYLEGFSAQFLSLSNAMFVAEQSFFDYNSAKENLTNIQRQISEEVSIINSTVLREIEKSESIVPARTPGDALEENSRIAKTQIEYLDSEASRPLSSDQKMRLSIGYNQLSNATALRQATLRSVADKCAELSARLEPLR